MIPEGWNKQTVGDMFEVQLGKMLNKTARQKQPQFPYFGNSNVKWGKFEFDNLLSMHFSEKERDKFSLIQGDILLCEGGEVGRCAIWKNELVNCYYQKALHRLRSKGGIIPEFFQSYMQYIRDSKLLNDLTTKTSIAHLTKEKLVRLPIKVPPLAEQTKITNILSTWDKAIATVEKLIENSRAQKKALMQQLLTGGNRFLKFSEEWKSSVLVDLCEKLTKGTTPSTSGYNFLPIGINFVKVESVTKDGQLNTKKFAYIGKDCHAAFNRSQLKHGDILFSIAGALGRVARVRNEYLPANTNQALAIIRLRTGNRCDKDYLYFYLRGNYIQRSLIALTAQAAQPNLSLRDIGKLKIMLPTIAEQKTITSVLSTADLEIETLQKKLNSLKQEKKALMQQLLTGKRRVIVDHTNKKLRKDKESA